VDPLTSDINDGGWTEELAVEIPLIQVGVDPEQALDITTYASAIYTSETTATLVNATITGTWTNGSVTVQNSDLVNCVVLSFTVIPGGTDALNCQVSWQQPSVPGATPTVPFTFKTVPDYLPSNINAVVPLSGVQNVISFETNGNPTPPDYLEYFTFLGTGNYINSISFTSGEHPMLNVKSVIFDIAIIP
jgi:hypothetical protein